MELIVASAIVTIALVPALRLTRDSMRISRNIESANVLATLCASKLEEHLALAAADWATATDAGDFAPEQPTMRYSAVRSDAPADGGIPGLLLAISVTAWEDLNANTFWDTGEPRVQFASKLSKMVSYEYEAKGS